ncbi:MAG: hypothetical protein GVY23_02350 [Spirochaetes bacterium]|jgi:uncharacterized protein (UPF0548 family)|nr:hypothetical protein [Spirochaetota bacterium]
MMRGAWGRPIGNGDRAIGTIASLTATEIAKKVNSALNAVVIPLFEQACRDAETADETRRRGAALGPLHVVPMSIKEQFLVKHTATTFGLPHQRRHRAALRWGWEGMSAGVSANRRTFAAFRG